MPVKPSDTQVTGLFLDMLAAEQGAGANTLSAYRRDLEDLSKQATLEDVFVRVRARGGSGVKAEDIVAILREHRGE